MTLVTLNSAKAALEHLGQGVDSARTSDALAMLKTGPSVSAEAVELLSIWQTWLGSERAACDEAGKQLWDRIEAVIRPGNIDGSTA